MVLFRRVKYSRRSSCERCTRHFIFSQESAWSNGVKVKKPLYSELTHHRCKLEVWLKKTSSRIIAPGRCFRRDTVDATHSANFHQTEGLFVDKKVTLKDLKGVLDFFLKELFGEKVKTRLRPSFFPFTEPSFEVDLKAPT